LFFTKKNNGEMKKTFNPVTYALVLFIAFASLFIVAKDDARTITRYADATNVISGYRYDISSEALPSEIPSYVTYSKPLSPVSAAVATPAPFTSAEEEPIIEEIEEEILPEFAIQAAERAIDEQSKEVIIRNEDPSTGKTTTIIYKSVLVNGEWTAEPVMFVTENEPSDSCTEPKEPTMIQFDREQ
jgi:hypothetical protein